MSDMSISPILLSAKEAKRPYALARSSLDTAMQGRALGWGFRKTAAQLYCPNTLESCMLGYLEVKSTKRFDDWYASLRDKIAKKAVDRRIARVAAGNRLLHPCCEAHQTVCCGTPLLSGIRRRLSLCHVHESSAARIGRCLHLPDGQRVGARATASQSASRENQGKQTP